MTNGRGRPAYRRVAGAALMVLGAVLVGYGAHYLIQNGSCSSTGYASTGTVPRCGGGEGLSVLSVFFRTGDPPEQWLLNSRRGGRRRS
jgi:hypothetical protein